VVTPTLLSGRFIRLEPLALEHLPGLVEVGCDPELWRLTVQNGSTPEAMRAWVEAAVEDARRGDHQITWTGRVRDSVYYSIVDEEWPAVKALLERKLRA
jgi:hypothetical protein